MEQQSETESSSSSKPNSSSTDERKKKKERKLPTPRDLISHYEGKGMDTEQASLKVIEDLQTALFRIVSSSKRNSSSDIPKKLDIIHSRLLSLDTKVDSKPGYPQTLAIGFASAALAGAVSQIWGAVRRVTGGANN